MIKLLKAALDLQTFFLNREWEFCFIGGLALQCWGEPRVTQDIDVTLLTGFSHEEDYIRTLLEHYRGRIDDAEQFALVNRVLLVMSEDGVGIDIALGGLPFEQEAIERAVLFEYQSGVNLKTASAEDLVIMKAFAARDRDWDDVRGIIVRHGPRLDWTRIERHLSILAELKEEPEILTRLQSLKRHVAQLRPGALPKTR